MNPGSFSLVTLNQITTSEISKLPQVIFLKVRSTFDYFPIQQLSYQEVHIL